MNNLKTALIVVLLVGALYGAYQFLNQRDVPPPQEVQLQFDQGIAPPTIEFGAPDAEFAPVPVSVPATLPGAESPAGTSSLPNFSVMPPPSAPKFDPPPSPETAPPPLVEAPPATEASNVVVASEEQPLRTVEPSAYTDPSTDTEQPTRVAARDASTTSNPNEAVPNLQANPWYRPERKAASDATGGMSPEAARQANRAAFQRAWNDAREMVESGKFKQALAELTPYYAHADLTAVEQQQLQKTLDSLAGRVIYSTEHYLLEQPHIVRADETLMDIAAKYNVQWQLLQNINGIRDPYVLVPKTQIKVVPGPFRAEVSLQTSHLTLFVDKYYAGRFPVSIGSDPLPPPGEYTVRDKRDGKDYYPSNGGRTIPAAHPSNPYGLHWIDLGGEVCIHGSAERDVSTEFGCISLSPRDAADVWGILSLGSTVTIRR